LKKLNRGE